MSRIHHFIKGFIFLGFFVYIVFLDKKGDLQLYIAPRMEIYVKLAALGLFIVALYHIYYFFMKKDQHGVHCNCGHSHTTPSSFKSLIVYSVFLMPILLGFLTPDTILGSQMAEQKGVNFSSANSLKTDESNEITQKVESEDISSKNEMNSDDFNNANPKNDMLNGVEIIIETSYPYTDDETEELTEVQPQESIVDPSSKTMTEQSEEDLDSLFASEIFTEVYANYGKQIYTQDIIQVQEDIYIETLTTLDLFLDAFIGKKIEISGFIFRADGMNENEFAVGRFAVQCCSADASPYGVFLEYNDAESWADDEWVTIIGTIDKTTFNDFEIMKVNVKEIIRIDTPAEPYVYPNYNFGL
ncbi:TIGR03943 family putative permease subunit [Chengkuizengella marina]|uniref:TIGR03943 family protein n=1 Tax=Chengkuizengella marina TaxID=2507566 RepID=A0A6N9Q425_9BACL|nr:TIGR03943 family protein [Chengkuizengella marina]NBI29589.1 TIGR03943 family protein [Chengkuizengella marina]